MPGTCGTISMLGIALLTYKFIPGLGTFSFSLGAALVMAIASVKLIDKALAYGFFPERDDPQQVVIDEWAGFLVAAVGHGGDPLRLFICFLLFRVFDMSKPPPIKKLEALPGGLGITADDLLAGIYANFVAWGFVIFFGL